MDNTENKKSNCKNQFAEFYNYKYWREIQRNQLSASANLFFVLNSAIFGFVINLLIKDKNKLNCISKTLLLTSLIFLLISFVYYIFFTQNRLDDYRETSKAIKNKIIKDIQIDKSNYKDLSKITENLGEKSWNFYYCQRNTLMIGFGVSLIGILIYIFN
ncbi:hypothetical protein [Flavobacterium sp.]|jgi:hypothetical protein|uniref:hypothetical protein n=1 Tax=Flavobacterium sp. TaxID=239 RepID=UPI0037C129D4